MRMLGPFHHGAAAESDNFVQRFIDSDFGMFAATTMHTFGALLFTAAIALYLYQAHLIRLARQSARMPSLKWLPLAHILNIFGIGMNGIGGLMRLTQGDHPGLEQLGTSTWVQVLLIKHLFLVVGVGLGLWLTAQTYWMSTKKEAPQNFLPHTRRISTFAVGSFATILIASILGGIASISPLPAMEQDGAGAATGESGANSPAGFTGPAVQYTNVTGRITGTPLQPGRASSDLVVPEGAREVWVELTWTQPRSSLDVTLTAPDNQKVEAKRTPGTGRVELLVTSIPDAGTWTLAVTTQQAVDEPFRVMTRVTTGQPSGSMAEKTLNVNPKQALGFAEINLGMKPGERFAYTWTVVDVDQELEFNIHYHVNGDTQYPVRETKKEYSGTYEHKAEYGDGISLMWENPSSSAVKVYCRIEGQFVIESISVF